jgi:hypothetical protein
MWALGIVSFMIPLITIIRMRGREGKSIGGIEGDTRRVATSRNPSLSSMTTEEYRATLRSRMRRRR